jgi:two-component system OmpR family sensor kinase
MSIRLRLTLLYSVILALTLVGFSGMLYGWQWRSVRSREEDMLASSARRIAGARQWADQETAGPQLEERRPEEHPPEERGLPPIPPFGEEPPNREFGAWTMYVQIIDLEGQPVLQSENLGEVVLPLSDAGQDAVWNGEPWVESATVEDEHLLIHSEPVISEGQVIEVVQLARSLADQDQYLSTLGTNLLAGSGIVTVFAFGIGWLLSGLVLRPIHRITQTAQAIGTERDLSRRVQYAGPNDEIGQLATTFNAMLAELQAAYHQVEQALQQQRQFVADVSHELRTPLTTLRGNLGLLRREPSISTEDREDILDDMVGESDRLIRLVSDLLTLARAGAGRLLQSEPVAVRPLIEDVCRQARLLDPKRAITCDDLADVLVVADRDALKQVLLILMDNSLKHATGPITVSATSPAQTGLGNPPRIAISICDSGPGIDPEALPHIFERFYRGEATESGIGLGLSIAKALIEAQNGTLAIQSEPGQSTTAIITIPTP